MNDQYPSWVTDDHKLPHSEQAWPPLNPNVVLSRQAPEIGTLADKLIIGAPFPRQFAPIRSNCEHCFCRPDRQPEDTVDHRKCCMCGTRHASGVAMG